jgi:hypothetical protein
MAGGIAGLVPQIERCNFIARQQRAADLRGSDGWCGHGRLSLDEISGQNCTVVPADSTQGEITRSRMIISQK